MTALMIRSTCHWIRGGDWQVSIQTRQVGIPAETLHHALPPGECHYRLNFLYLIRVGMVESVPRRRILSAS